ncbi:hypothetical protein DL96DRAFT_1551802 [Flagelloscypha sp. PMI_526]|nr:hypothetical protein DL96DRAFT_1551802 [Flagelloscypha sp. PMI_526]
MAAMLFLLALLRALPFSMAQGVSQGHCPAVKGIEAIARSADEVVLCKYQSDLTCIYQNGTYLGPVAPHGNFGMDCAQPLGANEDCPTVLGEGAKNITVDEETKTCSYDLRFDCLYNTTSLDFIPDSVPEYNANCPDMLKTDEVEAHASDTLLRRTFGVRKTLRYAV